MIMFMFFTLVARKPKTKLSNSSSEQFITLKPDIGPPVVYKLVTRPPLAGPYAFSNIPIPVWNHPRVFLNEDMADTWLFSNYSVGYGLFVHKYLCFCPIFVLICRTQHKCTLISCILCRVDTFIILYCIFLA